MEEYPVISKIRTAMKNDDRITLAQTQEYKRRLERSDFLKVHVELLQSYDNRRIKISKLLNKEIKERKRLEILLNGGKYEEAKRRMIDEYGEKSYEYQIFTGTNILLK